MASESREDESQSQIPVKFSVMDCLRFMSPEDDALFLDDASSVTALSIPFSDAPLNKYMRSKLGLKKSFSSVHEQVMSTLKSASSMSDSLFVVQMPTRPSQPHCDEEWEQEIRERLNHPDIRLTPPPQPISNEEDAIKEGDDTAKKEEKKMAEQAKESDEEVYDTMSGLWRMLETYDDFVITDPGFHAFRQAEPHWSEKPAPSWKTMEDARVRCEEWMEKSSPYLKKKITVKKTSVKQSS